MYYSTGEEFQGSANILTFGAVRIRMPRERRRRFFNFDLAGLVQSRSSSIFAADGYDWWRYRRRQRIVMVGRRGRRRGGGRFALRLGAVAQNRGPHVRITHRVAGTARMALTRQHIVAGGQLMSQRRTLLLVVLLLSFVVRHDSSVI